MCISRASLVTATASCLARVAYHLERRPVRGDGGQERDCLRSTGK
jgi:hypothetical protein